MDFETYYFSLQKEPEIIYEIEASCFPNACIKFMFLLKELGKVENGKEQEFMNENPIHWNEKPRLLNADISLRIV